MCSTMALLSYLICHSDNFPCLGFCIDFWRLIKVAEMTKNVSNETILFLHDTLKSAPISLHFIFMQLATVLVMRQVPLERDINIAVNGPFWVEVATPEHPFTAMLISRSRGPCLIARYLP